jgi:hypothetical protein
MKEDICYNKYMHMYTLIVRFSQDINDVNNGEEKLAKPTCRQNNS